MKAKRSIMIVGVAFVLLMVVLSVLPVKATTYPIWPCEGSQNVSAYSELDVSVTFDPDTIGSSSTTFGWEGECPAVVLKSSVPVPDSKNYSIRIAADQALGIFFHSNPYNRVMGYPAVDVSSSFKLYVPDSRVEEFIARGLHPVPFSQVTDWSWEKMLGASSSDTVAQWIGEGIQLGGVYEHQSELVFGMQPTSPNPSNIYVTWVEKKYTLFLPIIVH